MMLIVCNNCGGTGEDRDHEMGWCIFCDHGYIDTDESDWDDCDDGDEGEQK